MRMTHIKYSNCSTLESIIGESLASEGWYEKRYLTFDPGNEMNDFDS